jgi:hypothetical protein
MDIVPGGVNMKAIASLAFGLASAVGVCIAGASLASYVVAEPEHASIRKDIQPDLWTLEPRRIVQSQQHYDRLPAALSSYAEQERRRTALRPDVSVDQPQAPAIEATPADAVQSSGHQEWCNARYRSFDSATDTYRSFSGERRACVSPIADGSAPVTSAIRIDRGPYLAVRRQTGFL